MRIISSILLNIIIAVPVYGQFHLLKDVNPGTGSSNELFIMKMKPGVWIASWNGGVGLGQELWRTDGTPAGTSLIRDLYPGGGWGVGYSSDPVGSLMNGQYYFTGSEDGIDFGLYKTDATSAGTTVVKTQIIVGDITNIDNTFYFSGSNTQHGIELYKSDGTTAGTVLVKDIFPGPGNGVTSQGRGEVFVKANNYVFFRANDGIHGYELWRTDGTAAGTQLVKDILPGSGDGLPSIYSYVSTMQYMIEWKGNLFFVAQGMANQQELWRTDGTESGTVKVTQLNSSNYRPFVSQLLILRDRLYFLYKMNDGKVKLIGSDGTTAGTTEILSQSFDLTSEYIIKGYSLLYFSAYTQQTGFELWRSDGTAAGTFMVKDLNPGPGSGLGNQIYETNCITSWDDIYFSGDNGQTGSEIYKSDGSLGSGSVIFEAVPGITGSSPYGFYNVGNKLSVRLQVSPYGEEPWISDIPILFSELLSFTGTLNGPSANLEWKIRNEESNTSGFELERSTDSISFNGIATIQATGANTIQQVYQYPDPLLAPGKYYYRLKVINTDGKFKYSNVVVLQYGIQGGGGTGGTENIFKIISNPVSGSVNIKISTTGTDEELQIIDMLGRVIKREKLLPISGVHTVTVDLQNAAAGEYILCYFRKGNKVRSVPFIFGL